MSAIDHSAGEIADGPNRPTSRRGQRLRRLTVALLLTATPVISGCTPEEIEMSVEQIAISFEQGGVERGLAEAVFVARLAIPTIGMRLGSAFGP